MASCRSYFKGAPQTDAVHAAAAAAPTGAAPPPPPSSDDADASSSNDDTAPIQLFGSIPLYLFSQFASAYSPAESAVVVNRRKGIYTGLLKQRIVYEQPKHAYNAYEDATSTPSQMHIVDCLNCHDASNNNNGEDEGDSTSVTTREKRYLEQICAYNQEFGPSFIAYAQMLSSVEFPQVPMAKLMRYYIPAPCVLPRRAPGQVTLRFELVNNAGETRAELIRKMGTNGGIELRCNRAHLNEIREQFCSQYGIGVKTEPTGRTRDWKAIVHCIRVVAVHHNLSGATLAIRAAPHSAATKTLYVSSLECGAVPQHKQCVYKPHDYILKHADFSRYALFRWHASRQDFFRCQTAQNEPGIPSNLPCRVITIYPDDMTRIRADSLSWFVCDNWANLQCKFWEKFYAVANENLAKLRSGKNSSSACILYPYPTPSGAGYKVFIPDRVFEEVWQEQFDLFHRDKHCYDFTNPSIQVSLSSSSSCPADELRSMYEQYEAIRRRHDQIDPTTRYAQLSVECVLDVEACWPIGMDTHELANLAQSIATPTNSSSSNSAFEHAKTQRTLDLH